MAGATVIITDTERNVSRTLTTDSSGVYNAPNLLPSTYKVRAEAKGFKATERENIILEVGGELRVDLTMQPGEVTQTITVTEALPMLETTNAELGGTLQSQVIANLPLNGRNFTNMLQLRPGVTAYPGGAGSTMSTNGLRPEDNVYMINGVMVSDPWIGQSEFNNVLAAGDAGTILPVDAIDEFRTEENPRAEYGWKPGATVNIGVKSGTNALHGSAYAYGRDTVLDARNYFNSGSGPNPTKQPVALEQFGGTVGGPIKKDKLFYFANFEGLRYGIGNPVAVAAPTQAQIISACTTALTAGPEGTSLVTPLSASLAGLTNACVPIPSKLTKDPGGNTFQGLFPADTPANGLLPSDLVSTNAINGGLMKVDYHPSEKHSLDGMYFFSQGDTVSVDTPAEQVSEAFLTKQHNRVQVASGSWTYVPSSTLVNEVRFGYAHADWFYVGNDSSQNPANYNFNGNTYEMPTGITNPLYGGMPGIQLGPYAGGFGNQLIGITWPKYIGPNEVLNFVDHVSITHGTHAFKFGGEIIGNKSTSDETANAKGPVRFGNTANGNTALENFFEGNLHQANLFLGNPMITLSSESFAGFLQDDWRVKPRLTFNLGVRYELNTVPSEKNGLQAIFDPIRGLVQTNPPYHGDHNNFAPRVGFAWDIGGNGKTVLRGAGGILYELLTFDVLNGNGNFLGLRTIPTGLPLFNGTTPYIGGVQQPLPLNGNITLQSLVFNNSSSLAPIDTAWQNFNPNCPVFANSVAGCNPNGQTTLYASVKTPACGDGINNPNHAVYLAPPTPCEIYTVNPNLRTPYVDNWSLDIQRAITNSLSVDIAYVGNHGTKLLGPLNINAPPPGAGWAPVIAGCAGSTACLEGLNPGSVNTAAEQAAQPFTAPCAAAVGVGANGPGGPFNPTNSCFSFLSYITQVNNIYESNYNGMQVALTGRNYHGLTFTAGYTYSHALGEGSSQGTSGNLPAPENSYGNFRQELYAATDFDIRHRFTLSFNYAIPGKKGFGQLLEGWSLNSIVVITSGLPWGLADLTSDFSGTGQIGSSSQVQGEQWNFFGSPSDFTPVHGWTDTNGGTGGVPFFPGSGIPSAPTSNAACNAKAASMGPLAVASLASVGCYAVGKSIMIPPPLGSLGTTPPDLFRDGGYKNWDMSVSKLFTIKERLKAEGRVEFFNILNHPHWSNPEGGTGGTTGGQDPEAVPWGFFGGTPDTYSSNPQLGSGGNRAIQLGLKLSW